MLIIDDNNNVDNNKNIYIYFYCSKALDKTDFYHGPPIISANGQVALLFISLGVIQLLDSATQLHSDGTFFAVPEIFDQLYTIHVSAFGKVKNISVFF